MLNERVCFEEMWNSDIQQDKILSHCPKPFDEITYSVDSIAIFDLKER
jgi:hypothetical protein